MRTSTDNNSSAFFVQNHILFMTKIFFYQLSITHCIQVIAVCLKRPGKTIARVQFYSLCQCIGIANFMQTFIPLQRGV